MMTKLIDLLKITDSLSDIVIWEHCLNEETEDDTPLFEGIVADVPWVLAEMYLAKGLEENMFAISVRNSEEGKALLIVSVSEDNIKEE